jgi:predicted O-methyltransferase YrrM
MTRRTLQLTDALHAWLLDSSLREPELLRRLREETARLPEADMQSAPEQVQLMALLLRLMGARRVLEIGVFTGYGTLGMALALPEGGQVVALDANEHWPAIGRQFWREARVEERIELRTGQASDLLDALLAEGQAGSFDFAYVDADKKSYDLYYERSLALLRPGGLVALDNMLWGGSVADPADQDHQTRALRALTRKIQADSRLDLSLLPIADGLMLAWKRPAA